ncbi:restriction endonuclease subunit S [Sporolactobacillus sp. THM19-2]|uniref:restriction endonuclease subunit S n=1 Tax=Sporolactobacillus sp. THM19-2 TaxID=2511171 RepID=UPI001020DFBB|nr:restriction endonuclease subunit S [Sporolactobacillus sp. THM19-2]RYL92409.1 restriction endonuclease subunit S [Sporolactobacillus sp. THM19-2]
MSCDSFRLVKLADLTIDGKGHYGIPASAVKYSKNLLTYLRITDINDDGTLNKADLKSVDDPKAQKYVLKENDIVFARTGNSTGRSYYYNPNDGKLVYAGYLIKFSLDPNKINPMYMKYYTLSDDYRDWVSSFSTGSTRKNINSKTYGDMKLRIPIREQQDLTVKILSSIDKQIDINTRINHNLEAMAQAIFKHWFVDFEFPDKNGNPYKSSGGEMVESELGMIPKGWKVYDLKTLSNMRNGVNYIRNQKGIPTKVINVRNFDGSLIVNQSKLDVVDLPQKQIEEYKLEKFDTVIVRSAKPGETMLNIEVNSNVVYSGFTIRVRTEENMKIYVFYYLRNSIKILNNSSNGTVFKNLNQKILGSLKVIVPSEDILILYNGIMKGYLKLLVEKNKEVSHLIKLRDTLLPKLMSGEIRVPTKQTVK